MSRIYVVTTTVAANDSDGVFTDTRLVKADNPSQARNYVTRASITVKYAEQESIVELLSKGCEVEDATDPTALQPTLPEV